MTLWERVRSRLSVSEPRDIHKNNVTSKENESQTSHEHVTTSVPPQASASTVRPHSHDDLALTNNPGALSPRGLTMAAASKGTSRQIDVMNDPYDPVSNPDGYVNLGVADNYAMLHHVQEYINANIQIDARACSYGTGGTGSPRLKHALAALYNDKFAPHSPVETEHIHFSAGCTALCEMLGWNLASAGDSVVLSAPIYGAFSEDFVYKSALRMVHVDTGDDDPLGPGAPKYYEARLNELAGAQDGTRPRILLICTPHNPLGKCYDRATMVEFCKLAKKFDMHLICDEVYAQSTFDPVVEGAVPFSSILSIDPAEHGLADDRIHVLYGFSKDIAAAGLRLGCVITRNMELRYALGAQAPMHWASSLSDTVAAQMLEDREWLERYTGESRRVLGANYKLVTDLLKKAGIEYYQGTSAGFFVWLNLAPYMDTSESPERGEELLHDSLFEAKVWTNTGKEFSSPRKGWFRIVFTQETPALYEGMRRIIVKIKGHELAQELTRPPPQERHVSLLASPGLRKELLSQADR